MEQNHIGRLARNPLGIRWPLPLQVREQLCRSFIRNVPPPDLWMRLPPAEIVVPPYPPPPLPSANGAFVNGHMQPPPPPPIPPPSAYAYGAVPPVEPPPAFQLFEVVQPNNIQPGRAIDHTSFHRPVYATPLRTDPVRSMNRSTATSVPTSSATSAAAPTTATPPATVPAATATATPVSVSTIWSSSSSSDSGMSDSEVCRYFSRGMCRFGEMCRFAHVLGENLWAANLYTPTSSTPSGGAATAASRTTRQSRHRNGTPAATSSSSTTSPPKPTSRAAVKTSSRSSVPAPATVATAITDDAAATKPTIVPSDPSSWVLAPVFVPNNQRHTVAVTAGMSYAQAVGDADGAGRMIELPDVPDANADDMERIGRGHSVLCPYLVQKPQQPTDAGGVDGVGSVGDTSSSTVGDGGGGGPPQCRYGARCVYDHGELCDMCGRWCLHPTDETQRKDHQTQCMLQHEANMELSFAVARSKDKTCGICFEVIMEKTGREQRFGILPNCNHIFCLQCIRKWRLAKQFDNKIIRACPECRVTSDYVCPSAYWVDTKEEKAKLLSDYRGALGVKDCKYFKKGNGKCPFGNKCFYRHALENGQLIDVGVPQRAARRHNHMGEVDALQLFLWDFMDDRDTQWLDDIALLLSDDEDDAEDPVMELVEHMLSRSNNRTS